MGRKCTTRPGTRIGKLVAVREHHQNRHHQTHWLWQCDCGGQRVDIPSHLRRASNPGCIDCTSGWKTNQDKRWPTTLQNRRFGLLVVLRIARPLRLHAPGQWSRSWWCRCDCGAELAVGETPGPGLSAPACPACLKRLEGVRSGESLRLARLVAGLTQTEAGARLGFRKQFWAWYERQESLAHPRYDRLWQALATPGAAPGA